MGAKLKSHNSIKKMTVKYMKELGTYKPQYDQIINIYADMLYQYQHISEQFEMGGYQVEVETEKSGGKKSPTLASLENLRKDIGTYSDRLKLNAKSYDSEIEKPKKEQSVAAALLARQGK